VENVDLPFVKAGMHIDTTDLKGIINTALTVTTEGNNSFNNFALNSVGDSVNELLYTSPYFYLF
jgi:hypothetical protein